MRDKILALMIQNQIGYLSGEQIAAECGISRAAVWKHIDQLKKRGCVIEAKPNCGYRLVSLPDSLDPTIVKTFDFSGLLKSGVTLKHFDSVDSTNEVAKRLAAKGEANKTVVVSEEQTAGKGRLNRDWVSKKGANLMFSILLRPDFRPQDASKVPIIAAVAVAQSLRNFAKLDAKVKWPNDVLVDGKKLCGIRCEMASDFDRIEYLVVGIGVNVNQVVFPRDIAEKATSVRGETNRTISRPQLLLSILTDFFDVYTKTFEEGKFDDVIVDYTKMSILFQEMVTVHAGDRETHGKCIGFDRDGCLVMQNEQNRRIRVIAGDVSVRSEKTYV